MDWVIAIIIKYKYLALFPLAAIEGPVVALAVGFLVHGGYLSFLPSYIVLLFGDLIPDMVYYYIGRFGNHKKLVDKYGAKSNLITNNFALIGKLWRDHGKKTMFLSKLAYGLSTPFLISAGLVKMPLRKFVSYAFSVTILQYAVLMMVGYYLGKSYEIALGYVKNVGILVAAALIVFIAAYVALSKYARKELVEMEKTELK